MRRARSQAIKPELIVLPPIYRYDFRWIPSKNLQIIIRPELREGEENQYSTRLPVFRLKNIGSGPALNIKCYWSVQGERVETVFMGSSVFSQFSPNVLDRMFSFSLRTDDSNIVSCSTYCSDYESIEIPYCIASQTTELVDALPMPNGIAGSVNIRLSLGERSNIVEFLSGPSVEITLEYNDVYGREHRRHFLVESRFMVIPDTGGLTPVQALQEKNLANIRGSVRFSVRPIKIEKAGWLKKLIKRIYKPLHVFNEY
jgi:hypothetical protein